MNDIVNLSSWEIMMAGQSAIMRVVENLKNKRRETYGSTKEDIWQRHVEGCLAECALAKFLDVYWSGKGIIFGSDVGDFDVRTTAKETNRLILHPEDPDERIYWFLCGSYGCYQVKGWIPAKEGKIQEFWKDPAGGRPAFFVPDKALHSPFDKPPSLLKT